MERILIVGSTLEIGRTEEVYRRGFISAGCEVCNFSWSEAAPVLSSRKVTDKVVRKLGKRWIVQQANKRLIDIAARFRPTLTFVVSPIFLMPETLLRLKEHGLAFVFFTDNPLDTHHTHSNSWVRDSLPLWSAAFIWSHDLVEELIDKGVGKAFFHAFCSDSVYHFPKRQESITHDVAFIGNWDDSGKREHFLQSISSYRLGLWGSSDWDTRCQIKSLHGRCSGVCNYEEIPAIMGNSHIGLNILRPQNEQGHNIRTFEIPACGTLMLSERSPNLLNLFVEDKEAVYFSTPEELFKKVSYLLANPNLIENISSAGYQKASQNKINHRIQEVHDVFDLCMSFSLFTAVI
jgi:spore maturation protein CgeB